MNMKEYKVRVGTGTKEWYLNRGSKNKQQLK